MSEENRQLGGEPVIRRVMGRQRMRWFGRKRQAPGSLDRASDRSDQKHLEEFARTRRGVEAFVEPPTTMTTTTVVLVAHDGEWTRRRVDDARAAHELARKLGIPAYDAAVMGYPQRMREWTRRNGGRGV